MKTRYFWVALCLLTGFVLGSSLGYHRGRMESSIEDFKTYDIWLTSYYGYPQYENFQLSDFLKARYYYFANRIPASAVEGHFDYGNVSFVGPAIGEDLTSPAYEYEVFKKRNADAKRYQTNSLGGDKEPGHSK